MDDLVKDHFIKKIGKGLLFCCVIISSLFFLSVVLNVIPQDINIQPSSLCGAESLLDPLIPEHTKLLTECLCIKMIGITSQTVR